MFVALLLMLVQNKLGVDLSTLTDHYDCLKQQNYSFVTIRAYRSYGAVDPNINTNLQRSNAAGLPTDIYMFPCIGKKTAKEQVDQLIKAVGGSAKREGLRQEIKVSQQGEFEVEDLYGTIWIDVETNNSPNCSWDAHSFKQNCQFIHQLVNAIQHHDKKVGIYASAYMWQTILGAKDACTDFTHLPLWYPHYDKTASFEDWEKMQFGGWNKPTIKQFQGTTVVCSTGVDLNFRQ